MSVEQSSALLSPAIRAFIAISLPPPILEPLRKFQTQLRAKIDSNAVRWTTEDQWHLTLKFLGNVDPAQLPNLINRVRSTTRDISPFTLSLETLGGFPSLRRPRVIWIGLGGELEPLKQLQSAIDRQTTGIGSHSEERHFKPHLTLGRVRDPRNQRPLVATGEAIDSTPVPSWPDWPVHELHLFQSKLSPQGAVYSVIESFSFAFRIRDR